MWRWRDEKVGPEYLLVNATDDMGKVSWRPPCVHDVDEEDDLIQVFKESVGASALSFIDDDLSFKHVCKITRTPSKSTKEESSNRSSGTFTRRVEFFHAMVQGILIRNKHDDEIDWLCVDDACERARYPEWRQLIRAAHQHITKQFYMTPYGVGVMTEDGGNRFVRCDWGGDIFLGKQDKKKIKKKKKKKNSDPICKTFSQTGSCSYGFKCRFSHNKKMIQTPQTTFHLNIKNKKKLFKNLCCFACKSRILTEKDFSKTQLLLESNLRRCRQCIAKSKQGESCELEDDPRTWNRDRIVRWAMSEHFTKAQSESIASFASRGHKLLQISGKALKNKIKGFRTGDSETAVEDRKRLRDLIEKLKTGLSV